MTNKKTHFGYEEVSQEEKDSRVQGVFSSVAQRYDVMNDLMSGGLHRWWKQQFITHLHPSDGTRLLDVAGGTGDIAFRFHEKAAKADKKVEITVYDRNPDMLEEGRERAINRGILDITWQEGDAEKLPFEDSSFDYCTIAFGIRNVTNIPAALAEFYRVLKPGGRFLCLEFSQINQPLLAKAYDFYSFNIIPKIGQAVAKDADSYRYLVESIRCFPDRENFARMITEAGFERVSHEALTQGVVSIHSGWRI